MALPNGELWPFCVVMAKAEKEGTPMCVLRLISRFDPIMVPPIHKRVPGRDPQCRSHPYQADAERTESPDRISPISARLG